MSLIPQLEDVFQMNFKHPQKIRELCSLCSSLILT